MRLTRPLTALLLLAVPVAAQLVSSHAPTGDKRAVTTPFGNVAVPKVADRAVARVNGVPLTDRDLLRMEYAIFPYARQHGGMPKSMEPQIRQGALDMIIFEEMVYQEALRRKMVIPVARINRAEAAFKAQFPSVPEFQRYLNAECKGSRRVLRERIRRSMLIERFFKLEVADKATVTEAEARAYFAKNPQQFQLGESFAIQSISIIPPDNATPEQLADARKRAEQIYKQAKATKNYQEFGLLAEKLSEDDFRVNMGDHRAVSREKLPPELLKIAASMKPGQVSDLIQLGTAYTVFRLNAHVAAGSMKFEDVKNRLIPSLEKDKYNQLRTELGQRLRKSAKIEIL